MSRLMARFAAGRWLAVVAGKNGRNAVAALGAVEAARRVPPLLPGREGHPHWSREQRRADSARREQGQRETRRLNLQERKAPKVQ